MTFVRVALDVPVDTLYDYRADRLKNAGPGRIVLVPFGKKIVVGVVVEAADTSLVASTRLRQAIASLDEFPPLPGDVLELLKFSSAYYHHAIGAVVMNALPTRLRRRNALKIERGVYRLTALGTNVRPAELPARSAARRAVLENLALHPDGLGASQLAGNPAATVVALRNLVKAGWVEMISARPDGGSPRPPQVLPGPTLTDAQQTAVVEIRGTFDRFAPWLLHGVTGSGKTEVYLELIATALTQHRQTLFLVPEINLTPQLETRIHARFPDTPIVRLNSGLNEGERLHGWLAAQAGHAGIVLGTRLAVFTPMPRLGLIIVDEEHDSSFKQAEGLRYSARDIALLRAKQRAVPIILGSATPSLETYHQVQRGRYRMLTLAQRANAAIPVIQTTDISGETLLDGISQATLKAIRETSKRGEQSLIYINRRGYAPVLICPGCGWTSGCPRCSVKLVVHLKSHQMRCHHCGHQEAIPANCTQCGNAELAPLGQGTQRVESALARIFPSARILRVDRDSTRRKNAWGEMRRQIHAQEVDILVGTQMLAKGHDFPALTLVCVINADASLYSTDYRASERLFANLMQVAGRAGRADLPGRVLVQTEFPAHPLYLALQRQDYAAFANEVLAERKQAGLPPYSYQAILRAEASRQDVAIEFLERAAACVDTAHSKVSIFDPVPANMSRLAGKERAQLTVQSGSRAALQRFLSTWAGQLDKLAERKVRWALDIDPQEP